ncbi:BTB/POZ domain-containing protein [Aspergillus mulundensis]|uniref:Uncharacterized protein n=1 Tax=Aspergillus mulundensis TaxID=1810919 RepID=A0A3D8T2J7_9EURO|nr:hypothetical protein DSM5745_00108 [Aspergillus mulundensis]RDW92786.1 hypothetical protein DSM5745_00108 [Aspergillus mulundensis]
MSGQPPTPDSSLKRQRKQSTSSTESNDRNKRLCVAKEDRLKTSGGVITILVGKEEKSFFVHDNLLRRSSAFFEKALDGPWIEATQRTVKLPEDNPEIFAIYAHYAHWLYSDNLAIVDNTSRESSLGDFFELTDCYVFGNKVLCPGFQNAVIDAYVMNWYNSSCRLLFRPGEEIVKRIYGNTAPGSALRRIVIDLYNRYGDKKWLDHWNEHEIPQEFAVDILRELLPAREKRYSDHGPLKASDYHV